MPSFDSPKPRAADPSHAAESRPAANPPPAAGSPSRPADVEISVSGRLGEAEARNVLDLVGAATEEDGVGPLSEHVMLHLRYGGDPRARNLLLVSGAVPGPRGGVVEVRTDG